MSKLLSVNVGLPRDVTWNGKTVRTSVWESPVDGRRMVRKLDIDGDAQADLAGHGGENRAVFCLPDGFLPLLGELFGPRRFYFRPVRRKLHRRGPDLVVRLAAAVRNAEPSRRIRLTVSPVPRKRIRPLS